MPYSKAPAKRLARSLHWPDLRYSPTGEEKLFFSAEEVPEGWTQTKPREVPNRPTQILDRDELVAKLTEMGVTINPIWGNAHMKRIIEGDASPAW